MGGNDISDLESLRSLNQLIVLMLFDNQISDLSLLGELINLQERSPGNNQSCQTASLQPLRNLEELLLFNNQVSDGRPLQSLPRFIWLALYNNAVTAATLLSMLLLRRLDLRGVPFDEDICPVEPASFCLFSDPMAQSTPNALEMFEGVMSQLPDV
ncbi:MAG: hypothetical protein AAFY26_24890 [Cyanobacteria bacterium J06638_22]